MHNHYYFLRQISARLRDKLIGWKIGECFTQNKNELVLGLYTADAEFYIQADQNPDFSCLSFPDIYSRAKKNSVDLFPEIAGKSVRDVEQYHFERAFSFHLDDGLILLFKLFGNLSNILLFMEGECVNVFKHGLHDEEKITLTALDKDPEITRKAFFESGCDPHKLSPVFDKKIQAYLQQQGFASGKPEKKWEIFSSALDILNDPQYYMIGTSAGLELSLMETGPVVARHHNPVTALNDFYSAYRKHTSLLTGKKQVDKILNDQRKKSISYLKKTRLKLEEIRIRSDYKQMADIVMANLHAIGSGRESVELYDFYRDKSITIRLNPALTPQKNAANYYRKAKNQAIEIKNLERNISKRETLLKKLEQQINTLKSIDNFADLKNFRLANGLTRDNQTAVADKPRFKIHTYMGFDICIGRNARNNDDLTFEYGFKEDLWLHARDVSGSHVLIKYQAGKPFPKPVIERAAQLAAWYSKNRNASACPVILTEKKYVRKSKGLPPGAVLVDKEEVLMVEPHDYA